MCGRLFNNLNPRQLRQIARCSVVRNQNRCRSSFNMGPTNYIPCIKKQNSDKKQFTEQKDKNQRRLEDEICLKQDLQQGDVKEEIIYEDEGCIASDLYIKSKTKYGQVSENKLDDNSDYGQMLTDEQVQQFQSDDPVEYYCEEFDTDRVLDFMYWGMKTEFQNIINIRSEEAEMKKTFKPLINNNRCIIISQGYFEWTPDKVPFVSYNSKQDYILMCGLYSKNDDQVMLLTRESFGQFDEIHHRMPVFIEESEIDLWLDPKNDYNDVLFNHLLKRDKRIYDEITSYRCSTNVNNIRDKSVKCLMSAEEHKKELEKNGISKFFQKKNPKTETKQNEESKSYFQKQKEIVQIEQTKQLASEFNNISMKDNEQNKKQENQIQSKEQCIEVNESQKNNQNYTLNNQNKSEKKNEVNNLKRKHEEEIDKKQQSEKKNKKIVTTSQDQFNEGLEEFFKNKNQKK